MNGLTAHRWPWLALLLSGGLLIGAWVFQYGLGYAPCQMCYWQRHAHKIVIVISVLAIVMNMVGFGSPRFWAMLIGLALLGSFAMAFWHVGVEYKWWEGPKTCLAGGTPNVGEFDPKDFLQSLDEPVKPPACSEAVWHFLSLSMAGWNAVISAVGAGLSFISSRRFSDA